MARRPVSAWRISLSRVTKRQLCFCDIVSRRRALWDRSGDVGQDDAFIRAVARELSEDASLRRELQDKPYLLIEAVFQIVDKDGHTVPFFLNEVQKDFIAQLEGNGRQRPYFILKGRQQGFTTLITAIQLCFAVVRRNFSGFTVADCDSNTLSIFNDKARCVYGRLPDRLRPHEKYNSKRELFFDKLNSSWRIATAKRDIGRSKTLQFIHYSEAAFYKCTLAELQSGLGEAAVSDALIVYESTANGYNEARELWRSGACINLFYEWWRTPEYRCTEYEYIDKADEWLRGRLEQLREIGLDREQLAWYARKYAGYLDKRLIRQEYPCTPEEAFVASGGCIFDMDRLNEQMLRVGRLPEGRLGYFTYRKVELPIHDEQGEVVAHECKLLDIQFKECRDGYIRLHEMPRVKEKDSLEYEEPYSLGGDTAGGGSAKTDSDYYTAKVISNIDGRTVATLRRRGMDDDLYAEQLYCLGMTYHKALIGIELNYSTQPTKLLWGKYNYPNMYMRTTLMDDVPTKTPGFMTTKQSKEVIISNLKTLIRERVEAEVDMQTLIELSTFIRYPDGSKAAMVGEHDDLVMALAIAHGISEQGERRWMLRKPPENTFIRDNFKNARQDEDGVLIDWE